MDCSAGIPASLLIKEISEENLASLLWEYGEERYSRRIARAIVVARQQSSITTTQQLAEIVAAAHPAWEHGRHPATRTFQAIRIAVNHELEELQQGLTYALDALRVGGRLLVISFHSLEDRRVKYFVQHQGCDEEAMPRRLPVKYKQSVSPLKWVTRAVRPSAEEILLNPRSRSAILRIAEKQS
jgi:16S rRNA (cytosine1402-N4)-methyltransferase